MPQKGLVTYSMFLLVMFDGCKFLIKPVTILPFHAVCRSLAFQTAPLQELVPWLPLQRLQALVFPCCVLDRPCRCWCVDNGIPYAAICVLISLLGNVLQATAHTCVRRITTRGKTARLLTLLDTAINTKVVHVLLLIRHRIIQLN